MCDNMNVVFDDIFSLTLSKIKLELSWDIFQKKNFILNNCQTLIKKITLNFEK